MRFGVFGFADALGCGLEGDLLRLHIFTLS